MSNRGKNVVTFGGSAYVAGEIAFDAAGELGRALAGAGYTVVNGGYGGTMLASAQAACEAGGHVIGVGCRIFSKSTPNPYCADLVWTDDLFARMQKLIELGDAYITLPGSTGTLAELAMVWELINKRLIPLRPLLCWGEFWRPIVEIFGQDGTQDPRLNTLGFPERRGELIQIVHNADEALAALRQFEAAQAKPA